MRAHFVHTARKPSEWDDLSKYSADAAAGSWDGEALDSRAADNVKRRVAELDNNQLEHLRAYGIGELTCALGQYAAQPQIWSGIISSSAQCLTEAHFVLRRKPDSKGLRIKDVAGIHLMKPWIEATNEAKDLVPIGNLLLTDTLESVSLQRKAELVSKCKGQVPKMSTVMRLEVASEVVGGAALLNATDLFANVLAEMYMARTGQSPRQVYIETDPLVLDIKREEGLKKINLVQVATNLGKLRKDEAEEGKIAQMCITRGSGLAFGFDRSLVPNDPPPLHNERASEIGQILLHSDRIGCPAIHGPMIEMALAAVPEVLIEADRQIRAA